MAKVQIEYFGVDGEGRNVTEAKRDAGRKIERIVRNLTPAIWAWRGWSVVIYPHSDGGQSYCIIHPDSDGSVYSCCSCDDTEKTAVRHLLTIAREAGDFEIPAWAERFADGLREDWRHNDAWQEAYREAKRIGETDPHEWACNHSREFYSEIPA